MEERPRYKVMENIFYFKRINAIGGTEQFLYEIAKKYHKYDITVFYSDADPQQLSRLRKYVRCQRYKKGQQVKCKKAFFNFNIDMIEDVEAEEYIFVCHAIYQEVGYYPTIHSKITKVIGVSLYSRDMIAKHIEQIGKEIEVECCYNPLTIEPVKKVIHLISATRLDDNTKGGRRIKKLIQALDYYAEQHNRNYLWLIFTNTTNRDYYSKNVCVMSGRVDIRPYIAESDYLVQLSNDMETYCYSVNEALSYGVPVITTPLTVLNEFNLTDDMRILCDWDMGNADEVAKQVFTRRHKRFKYEAPADRWEELLSLVPSTYNEKDKVKVRATDVWVKKNILDKYRCKIPEPNEVWEIDYERWEELEMFREKSGLKLVEVLDDGK